MKGFLGLKKKEFYFNKYIRLSKKVRTCTSSCLNSLLYLSIVFGNTFMVKLMYIFQKCCICAGTGTAWL